MDQFLDEVRDRISKNADNSTLIKAARTFMEASTLPKYSYNFSWLGRPIIQYPQDIVAMQELIWSIKPDLIIETGIAHGGSLIFSASMLEINAICGGPNDAMVLGIDIDIRSHNRAAVEAHPMSKRISMLEGSSVSTKIIDRVHREAASKQKIIVILDSNHTNEHVKAELAAYAPLVTLGSYCIVLDTFIDDMPSQLFMDRPWGPGNNPKTAVKEFITDHPGFIIDHEIHEKLLITVAPSGYLKRVRKSH